MTDEKPVSANFLPNLKAYLCYFNSPFLAKPIEYEKLPFTNNDEPGKQQF